MLATDPIPDLGPWSKTFLFAYNVTPKETWVAVIFTAADKKNQQKDCWNGDLLLGCKILQLWLPLSFGSCQDFLLHVVNELASQGLVSSQRVLSFDSDMLTRVGNMAASTTTELEAFMERFKHKKYSARLAPRFWSSEGPQADFRCFNVRQDCHSAGSISGTLWWLYCRLQDWSNHWPFYDQPAVLVLEGRAPFKFGHHQWD